MSNPVLLNYEDHKDIKVITKPGEKYGDNLWFTPTFPLEFRSIQAHYPIFFQKDPDTGKFYTVALLGFERDENLFLQGDSWNAGYIPLTVKRQPFLIGSQAETHDGEVRYKRVVHIDLDNLRVNKEEGQPLFANIGSVTTDYVNQVADMLETIHIGLQEGDAFIDALIEHDLLESFTLDIELVDGSRHNMLGFYTIQEDNLAALSSDVAGQLHQKGYLRAAHMVMASQSNLRHLINLKNQKISGQ